MSVSDATNSTKSIRLPAPPPPPTPPTPPKPPPRPRPPHPPPRPRPPKPPRCAAVWHLACADGRDALHWFKMHLCIKASALVVAVGCSPKPPRPPPRPKPPRCAAVRHPLVVGGVIHRNASRCICATQQPCLCLPLAAALNRLGLHHARSHPGMLQYGTLPALRAVIHCIASNTAGNTATVFVLAFGCSPKPPRPPPRPKPPRYAAIRHLACAGGRDPLHCIKYSCACQQQLLCLPLVAAPNRLGLRHAPSRPGTLQWLINCA